MPDNHRYVLRRDWIGTGGIVNWIMLNPSTADDVFDDPTIRKCIGFSKRWGFAGLVVTNLWSYRATIPGDLRKLSPQLASGPDNDIHILTQAEHAQKIVCAWGNEGGWLARDFRVMLLLRDYDLFCIRHTNLNYPAHPVREAYTAAPVQFRNAFAMETV